MCVFYFVFFPFTVILRIVRGNFLHFFIFITYLSLSLSAFFLSFPFGLYLSFDFFFYMCCLILSSLFIFSYSHFAELLSNISILSYYSSFLITLSSLFNFPPSSSLSHLSLPPLSSYLLSYFSLFLPSPSLLFPFLFFSFPSFPFLLISFPIFLFSFLHLSSLSFVLFPPFLPLPSYSIPIFLPSFLSFFDSIIIFSIYVHHGIFFSRAPVFVSRIANPDFGFYKENI